MQVLRATKSETSKVAARNEASRALGFISDEVRRARSIETDLTNLSTANRNLFGIASANIDSSTGALNSSATTNKKIVFALEIPERERHYKLRG